SGQHRAWLMSVCSVSLRSSRAERDVIVTRSPEGPRETARRLFINRQQSTGLTGPPAHNPVLARPLPVRFLDFSGEEAQQNTDHVAESNSVAGGTLQDAPPVRSERISVSVSDPNQVAASQGTIGVR